MTEGRQGWAPRRLLLLTCLLAVLAVVATRLQRWPRARLEHPVFERLFAFDDHHAALAVLASLALVAAFRPLRRLGARLPLALAERPVLAALAAGLALAACSQAVYLDHALSMDEYAPRMQAHAFASGALGASYPPALLERMVPFDGLFQAADPATGRVVSAYWPGLALLMTPFAAFGAEALLNPLLSVLALWLAFRLAADAAGSREAGGWALLFAVASAAFVVNAFSFYAMPALLAANLLYAWLLLRGTRLAVGLAGLVGGLALVLHNPVPHALFAAPWLLWMLADRARRRRLPYLLAGYVPFGLGVALAWPMLVHALGFGAPADGPSVGFAADWAARVGQVFALPTRDLVVARVAATWKLWIWSAPGLLLLALAALAVRPRPAIVVLGLASLTLTWLAYFLVPFDQGHGWGYRYVHSAWGVLPVAAALFVATRPRDRDGARWREWCGGLAVAGLLALPVFLWQVRANVAEQVARVVETPRTGRWVVFVAYDRLLYTLDLVQNLPGDERVVRLVGTGADSDAEFVRRHFPGATLVHRDARGSAWRLPATGAAAVDDAGT